MFGARFKARLKAARILGIPIFIRDGQNMDDFLLSKMEESVPILKFVIYKHCALRHCITSWLPVLVALVIYVTGGKDFVALDILKGSFFVERRSREKVPRQRCKRHWCTAIFMSSCRP